MFSARYHIRACLHRLFYANHQCNSTLLRTFSDGGIFKPLQDVKVLDLTRVLAGPYCTMILGDLGAKIIKVEIPGSGDDTRSWGPPWIKENHSAYFQSVNRNKKSITVNMKKKDGADLIKMLAGKCDVLVENYLPGKLSGMGLGYQELKQVAPHLVYVSITGFGQSGPYAQRAGYDNIAAAVGGLMHITGPEDGEPCRVGVAMTDLSTGLYAVIATLSALMHKKETGLGQHVDCNLLNTQVATLTHIASNYLNCDVEAKRYGTGHGSIVPYQVFKTKDSYLMVGAGNDRLYVDMCQKLELPELAEDSRFLTNDLRVNNRKELIEILSDRFLEKTTEEWIAILESGLCPFGPINNMKQVFSNPQVIHNDMIQQVFHPSLGNLKIPGPALKFSSGSLECQGPPPFLGEHTEEVLKDFLKLSMDKIEQLYKDQVVT